MIEEEAAIFTIIGNCTVIQSFLKMVSCALRKPSSPMIKAFFFSFSLSIINSFVICSFGFLKYVLFVFLELVSCG